MLALPYQLQETLRIGLDHGMDIVGGDAQIQHAGDELAQAFHWRGQGVAAEVRGHDAVFGTNGFDVARHFHDAPRDRHRHHRGPAAGTGHTGRARPAGRARHRRPDLDRPRPRTVTGQRLWHQTGEGVWDILGDDLAADIRTHTDTTEAGAGPLTDLVSLTLP